MENQEVFYHVVVTPDGQAGSISVEFGGKSHVLATDDDRHAKVLSAIKEGREQDIPDLVDIGKSFRDQGLDFEDGLLSVNGEAMPASLNTRILAHRTAGLPFDSLLKFWDKLKLNPSFNARKMLFDFLEHNRHPLTKDGNFIAYRGVTDDFKDRHTGKWDNSPGAVCEMARSEVDDNPNNTCSSGLHVAAFDYAYGFGPKRVIVEVSPEDVVCVPVDYNGTKMRVCKFKVLSETETKVSEELEYDLEDDDAEVSGLYAPGECADCGHMNDEDASFCNSCGMAV